MAWFKDLVTEADGESFEILAILGGLAIVAAIAFTGYQIYKDKGFDLFNFGGGIAALLASIGGGQRLKPQAPIAQAQPYSAPPTSRAPPGGEEEA